MDSRTFNGIGLRRREWVRYCSGSEGVELLEASFEHHVYERHIHDTYAIGVTRRGVQRFWCRGATHDSLPGNVIVIPPGEAHDGESGKEGGYTYRMYLTLEWCEDPERTGGKVAHDCDDPIDWQFNQAVQCCCEQE